MTTEVVATTTVPAETEQAQATYSALDLAVTMLQAADIDTSDADDSGLTLRGLGVARAIYPKLEEVERLAKTVRGRCERVIGAWLTQTGTTGAVLGGEPYAFKAIPGTYEYRAKELREACESLVGKVLTQAEIDLILPIVVIPEQVIPAHKEYAVDGAKLSQLLKKRGSTVVAADEVTFEAVVNGFRGRSAGVPKLVREK